MKFSTSKTSLQLDKGVTTAILISRYPKDNKKEPLAGMDSLGNTNPPMSLQLPLEQTLLTGPFGGPSILPAPRNV